MQQSHALQQQTQVQQQQAQQQQQQQMQQQKQQQQLLQQRQQQQLLQQQQQQHQQQQQMLQQQQQLQLQQQRQQQEAQLNYQRQQQLMAQQAQAQADDDGIEIENDFDDDEDDDDGVPSISADGNENDESKIRVVVRKRPISGKERGRGEMDVATVNASSSGVTIHEPKVKVDLTKFVESHRFMFDEVFDEASTNEEIYATTCKPLVSFFLNKGKATCFAYGQTGSGKTFTMMGPADGQTGQPGLYALAARDMFALINSTPAFGDLQIWVSFFEIYGGKLFDLLNGRAKLICREDSNRNVNVVGVMERKCANVNEMLETISYGNSVRSTGSTDANNDSSRSHAILQISVKRLVKKPGVKPKLKVHGKFSFIDLAGSERAADTSNNDRRTRLEGAEINKSLLALKECIRALDQGGKHLPFRGSQLTQVLKDSFVGNSRTLMIANISPNSGSCEHTLNTLRYADRVKELKRSGKKDNSKPFDAYMPHQGSKANVKVRQGVIASRDDIPSNNPPFQPPQTNIPSIPQLQQLSSQSALPTNIPMHSAAAVAPSPVTAKRGTRHNKAGSQYIDSDMNQDKESLNLLATHSELCSAILFEEEALVDTHRNAIDASMKQVKEEMELLKRHEARGYSVDEYVDQLDALLQKKLDSILELRGRLQSFKAHLTQEKQLSNTIHERMQWSQRKSISSMEGVGNDDFDINANRRPFSRQ